MIVKESISRDIARLIVWYPIRWAVRILPTSISFRIFSFMGTLHYHLSSGFRNHISSMMKMGLDGKVSSSPPWKSWTKKYSQLHHINQMQILIFPCISAEEMDQYHQYKGLEHLDNARLKGKGAILLHAHFGPAHLTLQALGLKGYPMIQVGLPVDEGLSFIGRKVAFRLRMIYENKIAADIIPATSFLRPVIKGLQENKVIMTTGDGAGGGRFVGEFIPLDFLGRKLEFATGPVNLARRSGAPLLPTFTLQDNIDHYRTIIHEPLDTNDNRTPPDIMQDWVKLLENYLIQYPHHWHFWDEFEQRIERAKITVPKE